MTASEEGSRRFVGIDLASDSGKTGCVWLTEERDPDGTPRGLTVELSDSSYGGSSGLDRLVEIGEAATLCAIDTPFGYPRRTLALLNGQGRNNGDEVDPPDYRYRRTDLAMRERLRFLDLSPNYVMSPLRMEVVRRALLLLTSSGEEIVEARLGRAKFLETSSRLSVVELLCQCSPTWGMHLERRLIADYKRSEKKHRERAVEARRAILFRLGSELNHQVGKGFLRFTCWREVAANPSAFDALFCAFTAYAEAVGKSGSYPPDWEQSAKVAGIEGWVFVPDWNGLLRALGGG